MEAWGSIKNKIGNNYQVAGSRHYMLTNGSSLGTRAIDVKTGGGFEYTVVADRGLDISLASYKGVNLVYQGPGGEAHPAFYDCSGSEWLRMFFAGLLTTCGPANIGPPCVDAGEALGLHGRFNSTPARNVCDLTDMEIGEIRITGELECSVLFGEKTRIKRTITSPVGSNFLRVEDVIHNDAGRSVPFTMLYHINFGYPLLDDCVKVNVNSASVEPHDEYSAKYMEDIERFSAPDACNTEKNYLHQFDADTTEGYATVFNPKLGTGMYIKFDTNTLPYMMQWKQEGIKDYALALEPCNVPCEKRNAQREKGLLPYLETGEKRRHTVEIGVIGKAEK